MFPKTRWFLVVLFSIAMAWMESAAVLYLRLLTHRIQSYQSDPLPLLAGVAQVELVREVATVLMLLAVGWLAGQTVRSRLAYFSIAFGFWDIFYYLFLIPLTGWPKSLLDWDILFLLPLPWWGPVIAPVSISLLLITGGTLVIQFDRTERPLWPDRRVPAACMVGAILVLYVFMSDAIRVLDQGADVIRQVLPTTFNWPLFGLGLALMALPVVNLAVLKRAKSKVPDAEGNLLRS
ncbi:MAG: hypothetical protein P8Y80_07985 [Acidobacteriota bacterium]|jgi:hypothetical protein